MRKSIILIIAMLCVCVSNTAAQTTWNPHAGLVTPLTENATVTASSTAANASPELVIDGDDQTQWVSDTAACYPDGFFSNESNALLRTDDTAATDGDISTNINVSTRYELELADTIGTFQFVGVRYGATEPVELLLYNMNLSGVEELWATLDPADSYTAQQIDTGVYVAFDRLILQSAAPFQLFEVGAVFDCAEHVTVDLGSVQTIGEIVTRHWAGGQTRSSTLWTSETGEDDAWNYAKSLDPDALQTQTHTFTTPLSARYIRIQHRLNREDYAKAYVWEITAYDENGRYGTPPTPTINPNTLNDLFGINGIWGWGHNSYSDLLAADEGANLYNAVASHARNYQNLNWDVTDPDNDPNFANMATDGTNAFWWLDWDREYQPWVDSGMELFVSVQFTASDFPPETWDDPYQAAYNYGVAFGTHFSGTVAAVDIGNEPWDYAADFYTQILDGMSAGIKSVAPEMVVLPAALQAEALDVPTDIWKNNYLGSRLTEPIAPNIDALNQHAYSWMTNNAGERVATYPEHPASTMHAIRNMVRWRDANMPDTPIYLTEWGWDSDGAGQSCDFNECVTEYEQAIYGVRGLLMAARYGVERATWFFYANLDDSTGLFSRSGLTGSAATNFAPKQSFTTFESVLDQIGDRHFIDVIREDDTAYIYVFGDADGTQTHVVAWRPITGDDTDTTIVDVSDLPFTSLTYAVAGDITLTETGIPITADPLIITLSSQTSPLAIETASITPITPLPLALILTLTLIMSCCSLYTIVDSGRSSL